MADENPTPSVENITGPVTVKPDADAVDVIPAVEESKAPTKSATPTVATGTGPGLVKAQREAIERILQYLSHYEEEYVLCRVCPMPC